MKFTKKQVNEILDRLEEMYPDAECALSHSSAFELLVAVMLSAQTTDKSVNMVTPELFRRFPDAKAIGSAELAELEELLRKVGMYKTKARNLKALCMKLAQEYDGQVPADYDKLTELPGVGRKSANVVLSVAFGEQRIAVDTHVFRVANRIGLAAEKDVLKTEMALMKLLPQSRWSRAHHCLVFHGRYCCEARKPRCAECGIRDYCAYSKEQAKKEKTKREHTKKGL